MESDPVPAMRSPTGCSPTDFAHRRQSWVPRYQQGPLTVPNKVVNQAHGVSAEGPCPGGLQRSRSVGPAGPAGRAGSRDPAPPGAEHRWASWVQGQRVVRAK